MNTSLKKIVSGVNMIKKWYYNSSSSPISKNIFHLPSLWEKRRDVFRINLRWLLRSNRTRDTINGRIVRFPTYESFWFCYQEIFYRDTYDFVTTKERPVILDIGAAYGMASLYWKMKYPKAIITAVEPTTEHYKLLRTNLTGTDVTTIQAAVTTKKGTVRVCYDGLSSSISVTGEEVPGITLASLLHGPIDFLKMDIEGAEYDVLPITDLSNVQEIIVECHKTIAPLRDLLTTQGFSTNVEGQLLRGWKNKKQHYTRGPVRHVLTGEKS